MNNPNFPFHEALEALQEANTDLWLASKEMEIAAVDRIQPGEEGVLFDFRQVQARAERAVRAACAAERPQSIYTRHRKH